MAEAKKWKLEAVEAEKKIHRFQTADAEAEAADAVKNLPLPDTMDACQYSSVEMTLIQRAFQM